jgi:hypothetical protein
VPSAGSPCFVPLCEPACLKPEFAIVLDQWKVAHAPRVMVSRAPGIAAATASLMAGVQE